MTMMTYIVDIHNSIPFSFHIFPLSTQILKQIISAIKTLNNIFSTVFIFKDFKDTIL